MMRPRKIFRRVRRWILSRTRRQRILVVAVLALGIVGALWGAGLVRFPAIEGLFREGGGDGSVVVESPPAGSRLLSGAVVEGFASGHGRVYVWVHGVNFAVPATMEGRAWHYTYAGGLSGERTLAFSLVHEGRWGPPTEVAYAFDVEAPTAEPSGWRKVFAPVEQILRPLVTVLVGQGSGDLDDNGVPDQWQGTFGAPSRGLLGRVAFLNPATAVLLVGAILVGAYAYRARDLHAFLLRRSQLRGRERLAREETERVRVREQSTLLLHRVRAIAGLQGQRLRAIERLRLRTIDAQRRGPGPAPAEPQPRRGGVLWFLRRKGGGG